MNTNNSIRTAIYATAVLVMTLACGTGVAQTLSSQPVAESQKMEIRTSFRSLATNFDAPTLSSSQVVNLTRSSINSALLDQVKSISTVTSNMVQNQITGTLRDIANGGTRNMVAPLVASTSRSLATSHNLTVHVSYEPRPIGGILAVRVDLVPQFSGVGVANRPVASKTMMTAVDNLDQKAVTELIASLSQQLTTSMLQGSI